MSPEPTHARRSKTSFSRSGSIGGFVTCAKRSRRYSALEERERGVVAHRRRRFARGGQDPDDVLELFARAAEALQLRERGRRARRLDTVVQGERPAPDDLAEIGAVAAFGAKLLGIHDFARREPHDQTAARPETAAANDLVVAEIDDAGFRGTEDAIARGPAPA